MREIDERALQYILEYPDLNIDERCIAFVRGWLVTWRAEFIAMAGFRAGW